MEKFKKILKQEFINGYTWFDRLFMLSMLAMQIVVFVLVPDSWISIVCGISGVISTVLCAKGKISFYFIGFVQTITYLILAWQNWFLGEILENLFYLVTMIWGIFLWKNNKKTVALVFGILSAVLGFFGLLQALGLLSGVPILAFGIPAVLSCYFDLFSGFVQALVFSLLSMVYIAGACPDPAEAEA